MSIKQAEKIISEILVGNFYSEFIVGDWWTLTFSNQFCIAAQEIFSTEEESLNILLNTYERSVLDGIDPEIVSKNIVLSRNLRKEVTQVSINERGFLELSFDNNWKIIFPTSTDTVDWHWCLNSTGNEPYKDYKVACFSAGVVKIWE